MTDNNIFFSIIIPTRNRPELFHQALKSVLDQSFINKEIIIVNDGSTEEFIKQYKKIEELYPAIQFNYLIHRPQGHGQSYSMNFGADQANGQYICFLDDDDFWTDNNYLQKAYDHISTYKKTVELYYSNQTAFFSNGDKQTEQVWIEDLIEKKSPDKQIHNDVFVVDSSFLLTSNGFAHLNCSIFKKDFYHSINGMDEGIRYECDRDIYIKSIDAAKTIIYNPDFISKHHIPDPKQSDNMSTMISIFEKKLFQLRVYDKGILFSKRRDVINFCRIGKGYQLKHITEALYASGRYKEAVYYARLALGAQPSLKWFAYTLLVIFKSLTKK